MKTAWNVPNAAGTIGTTIWRATTAACASTARLTTPARTAGSAPIARDTDAATAICVPIVQSYAPDAETPAVTVLIYVRTVTSALIV